jgi:DNA polymerase III delta prime subunit|tara:strand:- start:949 stop:1899 length:951 start_codon:yes stop_codon:yes gene_type:complete
MAFFEQTNNEQADNSLWTESYRPTRLEDYVGNEHLKSKVAGYLETGDVPHLLLYGRAGTGKTTLAKLIVKSVECDYMIINASSENNVETVRNKVTNFASSQGFKKWKIVILDEFDYMTQNAQAILRNLMETFSGHCRFILTCNYVEKVIDPIQSRCQTFQIVPPTKKDVAMQISKILNNEGVKFEIKDLVPIIDAGYPDIRKIINTCQLNSVKGVLQVDTKNLLENDYKMKVVDILKSSDDARNKYMNMRQTIIDSKVTDFTELFTLLYDKVDEYAPSNTANVIIALSQGQTNHFHSIDKEIPMAACLIEILNLLK